MRRVSEGRKDTMILITGGAYQGKREYARKRWNIETEEMADGKTCAPEAIKSSRLVFNLQALVRRMLEKTDVPGDTAEEASDVTLPDEGPGIQERIRALAAQNPDVILITDEIGCGIIPMNAFERRYREEAGRLSCALAAEAEEVVRVVCGVAVKLKG